MEIFQAAFGEHLILVVAFAIAGVCLGLFVASSHFAKSRHVGTSKPSALDARSDGAKARKRKKKPGSHLVSSDVRAESECLSTQGVFPADENDGTQAPDLQIAPSLADEIVGQEVDHENSPSVLEPTERVAKLLAKKAERKARKAQEMLEARAREVQEKEKVAAEIRKADEEKALKEAEAKAAADAANRAAEEKSKKDAEVAEAARKVAEEKARQEEQEKSIREAEKVAKEQAEKEAEAKAAADAEKIAAEEILKKAAEEMAIAEAARKQVEQEVKKEAQKQIVADAKTYEESIEKNSEKATQNQRPPQMQVDAVGSQRTLLEKEILKTEKKLREVAKLKEKIAVGEHLAANQLEKVSKAEELSDLLSQLQQRREEANARSASPNEDGISQHFEIQQCHSSGVDVGWPPQAYSSINAYPAPVPHQVQESRKNGRGVRKSLSTWAKEDGHSAEKRKGQRKPLPDGRLFDGSAMQPIALQDGWMVSLDGMPRHVASLIESDSGMPSTAVVPFLQQDCQFEPVGDTPWFQVGHDVNTCWDWVNQGTCPRGDTCQWHHPAFEPPQAPVFWDNEHNSIYPKYSPGYDFTECRGSQGS